VGEARWFWLSLDGVLWAVPQEAVWLLTGSVPIHPLPGARPWCEGWALLRDQVVPIFGGGPFAGRTHPPVLLALRRGGSLLALPADRVDRVTGTLRAGAGEESSLPVMGTLEGGGAPGAPVLDVDRLYRELGLPIESLTEDRG